MKKRNFFSGFPLRIALCMTVAGAFCNGCAAIGALASKIPQHTAPSYKRLAGQSVGIMVWADRAVLIDWNQLQLDLADDVQQHLRTSEAPEVKNCNWQTRPASIVRYQKDHPGDELLDITAIAPKLGVTRLIYVEVQQLSTRGADSLELFRGNANVSLKVLEISGSNATVGYQEQDIRASFPKHTTADGVLNSTDQIIYRGLIKAIAEQVANRLVTHDADPDNGGSDIPKD